MDYLQYVHHSKMLQMEIFYQVLNLVINGLPSIHLAIVDIMYNFNLGF